MERADLLRPGLRDWLTPFREEPPYPGIEAQERNFVADLGPRTLVILAALFYAIHFGQASWNTLAAFQQPGFDIGLYDQGLWLLSRFKSPFVTLMGLNLFGDHASYILLPFVPLYRVWPTVEWLIAGQTLALAVAAIPVYLLGKKYLQNAWMAVLPAFAFLLAPALGWLNLENFHPDSFEVPLVLFALYFVTQRRWRLYFVMICLLLIVKEDVAFLVVPLGIYVALKHHRRAGIMTVYVAALWFIITVFFLGPLLSGGEAGSLDSFRIPFGGWKGLFSAALNEPWDVISYMLQGDKIKYFVYLLTPLLFTPLFAAETLVVLPTILFNLLSTFAYQTSIRTHYHSLLVPIFAWSSLVFAGRVKDHGARRSLVVLMLLSTVLAAYLWGPAQWSRAPGQAYDPTHPEVLAVAEAVTLIPDDAVLACRARFATRLDHRERIYIFPTPFYAQYWGDLSSDEQRLPEADDVEYVLDIPERLSDVGKRVFMSLQDNEGFKVIFDKEGVVLLKRETQAAVATPVLKGAAPASAAGVPAYN